METQIRVLLFDLDGTLLRNDKTLSEFTLEKISECRRRGYLTGISTSRSEQNCIGFIKALEPDIVISSGGALVRVNGTVISESSFSPAQTKHFIETVRKVCGMDCEITVDTTEAHYWNYKSDPKEQDKSWSDSIYTDFIDFDRPALKICALIPEADLARKLCDYFPELDCRRFSDGDWYKFTQSGITKEKAISDVCRELKFSPSEIMVFGDDYSDIGMLKMCGAGIAMGNAIWEVKDIADDITLSNEEDGAAVYLEKLMEKKKPGEVLDNTPTKN